MPALLGLFLFGQSAAEGVEFIQVGVCRVFVFVGYFAFLQLFTPVDARGVDEKAEEMTVQILHFKIEHVSFFVNGQSKCRCEAFEPVSADVLDPGVIADVAIEFFFHAVGIDGDTFVFKE